MILRKGKTKQILECSVDAALLAVEVYNKPRTTFRCQNYIILMVIAWTHLFHAIFRSTIGDKYYFKEGNRYIIVDGERKTWDLSTCINKYGTLKDTIRSNLEFFIGLRNKIEHRSTNRKEFDSLIFGECQALLYNYEDFLVQFFGEEYSVNENLVYSLQFSKIWTQEQRQANRRIVETEMRDIVNYIDTYRSNLSDEIFLSQEYSIKLIQIPRIANTNRKDLAIQFIKWDELSEEDRNNYGKLDAIIKTTVTLQEAANVDKLKTNEVCARFLNNTGIVLGYGEHKYLYTIFDIRPSDINKRDPAATNTAYCVYDALHKDYGYTQQWLDIITNGFKTGVLNKGDLKKMCEENVRLSTDDFR